MTRTELVSIWKTRRDLFSRFDATVNAVMLCDEFVAHVQAVWADEDKEWVPGAKAAQLSGYSQDHLRRLARNGEVTAEKRGRAYWYLVSSLPRKCRPEGTLGFDPSAAAAEVVRFSHKEDRRVA